LSVLDGALKELRFEDGALHEDPGASSFCARVRAYFKGDLCALDSAPLNPAGTPFQRAVWALVRAIPAGETRSYGEIARALGRPGASRAVGAANGANPVCLAIPCHRVIGASGALTGYAWGLHRKRWLLAHENPAALDKPRRESLPVAPASQ
jgi:methylated-DNA-[protein]-cysteine S-methyltransferase